MPQLCALATPRASAANLTLLATRTGVRRRVVVPSPSSPSPFHPQQYAAPAAVTPQLCSPPALTAAKEMPPATSTGTVLQDTGTSGLAVGHDSGPVVVPTPS